MKVSGSETCNMAKVVKSGPIQDQYLQVTSLKDYVTGTAFGFKRVKDMKETGSIT